VAKPKELPLEELGGGTADAEVADEFESLEATQEVIAHAVHRNVVKLARLGWLSELGCKQMKILHEIVAALAEQELKRFVVTSKVPPKSAEDRTAAAEAIATGGASSDPKSKVETRGQVALEAVRESIRKEGT
jgi:hypothetical protein